MRARRSAAVFLLAIVLHASSAGAQEIQLSGPLGVTQILRRLYRAGRVHLAVAPAYVLGDRGATPLVVAARADFHPTDDIGMGMWGGLGEATGWAGAGQLTLVPAHGKLSLFGCCIVPIDLFLFGGIGALTVNDAPRIGATFGGGMNVYAGEALAVSVEARALAAVAMLSVGVVLALPTVATTDCVYR